MTTNYTLICRSILPWAIILCAHGCGQNSPPDDSETKSVGQISDLQEQQNLAPLNDLTPSNIRFAERTENSNVEIVYRNGEQSKHFSLLESIGGGVGMLDYDLDGRTDLLIPGGGELSLDEQITGLPGALFRQRSPWHFEDISEQSDIDAVKNFTHGVAVGDYDNDGFPDVVITGYGGIQLFRNQGDGTFRERSKECQLVDDMWSSSAGWGDINGDGYLDLYIAHYVDWSFGNNPSCPGAHGAPREICTPKMFNGLTDSVFLNQADGTFKDATEESGIELQGKGLGVLLGDFDLDGKTDIYVCNDTVPNFLYHTGENSQLTDVSLMSGTSVNERGLPTGSMGISLGDFNLDGAFDIWVANYEHEGFALYRNRGNGLYQHSSKMAGVRNLDPSLVGWGTMFADFDQDGDEDIFGSNGHVNHVPLIGETAQAPILLDNQGGEYLQNGTPQAGEYFQSLHHGRGAAGGDLDNDGDIDLVVSRINQNIAILENTSIDQGEWLQLKLIGTLSPRLPIGATVILKTESSSQIRQLTGGNSYASTHDARLHFGLGKEPSSISLKIIWPSGIEQKLNRVSTNQTLRIIEPDTDISQRSDN